MKKLKIIPRTVDEPSTHLLAEIIINYCVKSTGKQLINLGICLQVGIYNLKSSWEYECSPKLQIQNTIRDSPSKHIMRYQPHSEHHPWKPENFGHVRPETNQPPIHAQMSLKKRQQVIGEQGKTQRCQPSECIDFSKSKAYKRYHISKSTAN